MLFVHIVSILAQGVSVLAVVNGVPGGDGNARSGTRSIPGSAHRDNGDSCTDSATIAMDLSVPYQAGNRIMLKAEDALKPAGYTHDFHDGVSATVSYFTFHTLQYVEDPNDKKFWQRVFYFAPKITIDNRSGQEKSVLWGIYDQTSDPSHDTNARPFLMLKVTAKAHSKNDDCLVLKEMFMQSPNQFTLQSVSK